MSISKFTFRFRGVLVSLPLVFAFACFNGKTEIWIDWPLGGAIFLLGLLVRVWAREYSPYRQEGVSHLATAGPYSLVRNPLYLGNTLMCLGVTVLSGLLWLVPVTLFWCAGIYSLVIRHEEARLLVRYGEPYRRYTLEVPRWFPHLVHLKDVGLINQNLRTSVATEIPCLLILFPYIIKEVVERWVEH